MARKGIDLSEWNGSIDWNKVKGNVDFVILREGYRQKQDARFTEYVAGAKSADISIDGVYHFIYATTTDEAKAEARSCIQNVLSVGLPKTVTIWADLEYDTVTKAAAAGIILSDKDQKDITLAFCEAVKAAGYRTGIYTNIDYLNRVYGKDIVNIYDIWLAQWNGKEPVAPCVYHQTGVSETNEIIGITGKVDLDMSYVMKATDFVNKAVDIAKNYKTLYVMGCFGAPMNSYNKKRYINNGAAGGYNARSDRKAMIQAASADTFGFDCVCLIKGILWGWNGNQNKSYGGASYASKGVPDIGANGMIQVCSGVSTNFSNIVPGEAVWKEDHIGIYIGNGLAVECTPAWQNKVQITAVGNIGSKSGYNTRQWTKHGKLPYIDYSEQAQTPAPAPKKTIDELAHEVINGKWGSGQTRKDRLTAAGYDYAAVQARVNEILKSNQTPTPKPAIPFEDVPESNATLYKAVKWMYDKGYTAGTSKTTFSPDKPLTRGEFAIFMERMFNK